MIAICNTCNHEWTIKATKDHRIKCPNCGSNRSLSLIEDNCPFCGTLGGCVCISRADELTQLRTALAECQADKGLLDSQTKNLREALDKCQTDLGHEKELNTPVDIEEANLFAELDALREVAKAAEYYRNSGDEGYASRLFKALSNLDRVREGK